LRLSSPAITHSKPRLISVGGSITSSPADTLLTGAAWAVAHSASRAETMNFLILHFPQACVGLFFCDALYAALTNAAN
jgi:hypothetical protein